MYEAKVLSILKESLNFDPISIEKIKEFRKLLLKENKNYNFISKNTEGDIWSRHILDSAQLVKFIDQKVEDLADLGTGGGFPGVVLALYNVKNKFHVKLYEKSPIKRAFLLNIKQKLALNYDVLGDIYDEKINSDVIVCRAFKKLDQIIKISREFCRKPHKLIILKGQNAQKDIKRIKLEKNYNYKLYKSITDDKSRIILINAVK